MIVSYCVGTQFSGTRNSSTHKFQWSKTHQIWMRYFSVQKMRKKIFHVRLQFLHPSATLHPQGEGSRGRLRVFGRGVPGGSWGGSCLQVACSVRTVQGFPQTHRQTDRQTDRKKESRQKDRRQTGGRQGDPSAIHITSWEKLTAVSSQYLWNSCQRHA